VLEANYLIYLLRPHHVNFNKRLVKMPKLYFYDVGLVSWLLGIRTPEQMMTHPLRGSIFETFVISELAKTSFNRGERPNMYFWRDSNGNEIDVVVERGTELMPIEIKSGKTVARDSYAGLDKWRALAGNSAVESTLIYGGKDEYCQNGIKVVGWEKCGELLK
jgi:predicted AAA+ superfamily ATPase